MPRRVSTVISPQTFTPERFFQLSPAHVSWNGSPSRGTEWNVHTSLPSCTSHARTSPAGPCAGPSCVRPPMMIRFLYMIGGELRPSLPGRPCMISGVLRSTTPFAPNLSLSSPVTASTEYSLPSEDPNTICGGVCLSPTKYSTPRVDGLPDGSGNAHFSLPVAGSSATTRPYGVETYITPLMTSGVVSPDANPLAPPPRPPRPCGGASPASAEAADAGGFM